MKLYEAHAAMRHTVSHSSGSVSDDLIGLSLRAAMKRLTPSAKRKSEADSKPRTSFDRTHPTTGLEIIAAWNAASPVERAHAVSNIGWRPLAQAIPADWVPSVERWIAEQRQPSNDSAVLIESGPDGFPEMPASLMRHH
jgi:hypothetical protein